MYILMITYNNYATSWSSNLQDGANEWIYGIIELHDKIVFYLIIIFVVVFYIFSRIILDMNKKKNHLPNLSHNNILEFIWTIIPAGILWIIGIPSIKFLYMIDQILEAEITIKAIGNQWYWSYEYENTDKIYDSFLIQENDLNVGDLRQLTVDNYLILPTHTNIRMLVTSNDVIHSFAIPSLAIKCDAIPGRLNSFAFNINRKGIFYGQCSELCGVLHGFMPIGIKAVSLSNFLSYLSSELS